VQFLLQTYANMVSYGIFASIQAPIYLNYFRFKFRLKEKTEESITPTLALSASSNWSLGLEKQACWVESMATMVKICLEQERVEDWINILAKDGSRGYSAIFLPCSVIFPRNNKICAFTKSSKIEDFQYHLRYPVLSAPSEFWEHDPLLLQMVDP